jgi:hypothetical protein
MVKTDVECTTKVRPGPKPKYTQEEAYHRQLEANKRYRQSARGKLQKKKDDEKYVKSEQGKQTRRAAQDRHRRTDKGKETYRRYWQSEKGRELLRQYWQSQRGKSLSRANAAVRRHLIRAQRIKDFYYEEIRKWYAECPTGFEVDHIVPIKHVDVCGLHVPWNFQYLTKTDNASKNNYFPKG